jgi:ATP synthase protein I
VFGTIGITIAACVFVGLGVGYYIDNKIFDGATTPWFTFFFLGLGIFAGFRNLYQMSKRTDL